MGLSYVGSSSSYDQCFGPDRCSYVSEAINWVKSRQNVKVLPNPDPTNYKILRVMQHEKAFAIEIQYPDCTNYEGKKILVYTCALVDLLNQKHIDPHFSDNKKFFSPIARFEPTEFGWYLANNVAMSIE